MSAGLVVMAVRAAATVAPLAHGCQAEHWRGVHAG